MIRLSRVQNVVVLTSCGQRKIVILTNQTWAGHEGSRGGDEADISGADHANLQGVLPGLWRSIAARVVVNNRAVGMPLT